MALSNIEPTVFDAKSVFQTLAASGFNESGVSALSRGLRSALNPEALQQFMADPIERPGFSADTPALFFHPNRLSIDNVLLLSELNSGFGVGGFGQADASATQVLDSLRESATIDSLPFIRNLSEDVLQTAFGILGASAALTAQFVDEAEEEITIRGTDFTLAPSENQAFGTTYTSVTSDSSLDSQFHSRFGLVQDASIKLSELVNYATTGNATHYAVSITRSEGDGAAGELLDSGGSAVSDEIVITAAELSDYSYSAPSNVGFDFINIIELEDSDSNGTYEGRGDYNSISVVTGEDAEEAFSTLTDDNDVEQIADYTFYSEAGTAADSFTLVFSGISAAGYTDAKAALDAGVFQLTISETLADGSVNEAVVDLYDSDLDEIKVNFAFDAAEYGMQSTGIDVNLRVADSSFDLDGVEVYARFA